MKKKRIIFAVFDTLHHEYRGFKAAGTFLDSGYEVKIAGIKYENDDLSGWDDIENERLRLYKAFTLSLNLLLFWLKLFVLLLREKGTIIYSHDIFPLLPVFLASRLKGIPYVYDAHEFWHGNSQVEFRPVAKKFWTVYERIFIKRAEKVITVSDPIARELEQIYGISKVGVFTNLPSKKEIPARRDLLHKTLGIGSEKKIILYQGHFLVNNGLDTVLRAFTQINDTAVLVLIGDGSEKSRLAALAGELGISRRVFFAGPFPHRELINYTVCACIGLCLIKNCGKSFYYSAPNKMFELIQAHVPQIASDFPEISKYVKGYEVGEVIDPEDEELIAETVNRLLRDEVRYNFLKNNCENASKELIWEKLEGELVEFLT